ncbi:MAG: helix-turn-helix domain-containing protein [Patescibacteria group bacterium]
MNTALLTKLGLTDSQAKTYLALIKAGRLTPPELAAKTGESRTAAYMALAKLEEVGLARPVEGARKQTYEPVNPAELERYLDRRRKELTEIEENYRDSLSGMLSYYYAHRNEPGVRFFQGEKGLTKIYEDHLRTGEDVYFVRTPADEQYFGKILYQYMTKRAQAGITAHGLAPYSERAATWAKQHDKQLKRDMTWYPRKAYTAPVEIAVYGNKVSLVSFGDEAIGTIIESPQIAQALRELLGMARAGAGELMRKIR